MNEPRKFRRKLTVQEAIQYGIACTTRGESFSNLVAIEAFVGTAGVVREFDYGTKLGIRTSYGSFEIQDGDWIIKDIQGVPYPCRREVFEELYEPVTS